MTNPLPFQYLHRAAYFERLDGMMRTAVLEQRDRELEDYLGMLSDEIATLRDRITELETP